MYHVSLYENGRFACHIGGPVRCLTEALAQMERIGNSLHGATVSNIIGVRFDREGTDCALVITDAWGAVIKDAI